MAAGHDVTRYSNLPYAPTVHDKYSKWQLDTMWHATVTYLTLERLSWQFGKELRPVDPRDITLRLLTRRGVIGRGDNWGAGTRVSMSSSNSILSSPSPRPVSRWGLNSMEYRDVRAPPFRFVPYLLTCATWAKKHVHIHNQMKYMCFRKGYS
jgi:hypothetical protein